MTLPPVEAVAVSSWSWHRPFYEGQLRLHQVPAEAARLGFGAVELNDFMLAPPRFSRLKELVRRAAGAMLGRNPKFPAELALYTRRNLERMRAALDKSGVRCVAWTVNSDLCVPESLWPWQQRYLRWGLFAARLLGASRLRVTLGGEADAPAEVEARAVRRLAALAAEAQKVAPGCTLVVENHWGLSTNPDRLLRILDAASTQTGMPIGLCFDPGNLLPEERERGWEILAPHAFHLHFKTYAFDAEGRETTLPYDRILPLVGPGCMTVAIEYEGDGDPTAGIEASRSLYRACV